MYIFFSTFFFLSNHCAEVDKHPFSTAKICGNSSGYLENYFLEKKMLFFIYLLLIKVQAGCLTNLRSELRHILPLFLKHSLE